MFVKSLFAFAVLAPAALATISIALPSNQAYWVANASNTITWSYSENDPNPISIVITNADSNTLNGEFSIEEYVPVSQESYTVTNVTLKPATGYVVNFVNVTDHTQIYAKSSEFEVKPGGTPVYGQTVFTTVVPVTRTVSGSAIVGSTTLVITSTSGVPISNSLLGTGASDAAASSTSGTASSTSTSSSNSNGSVKLSTGMWTGVAALGGALVATFLL